MDVCGIGARSGHTGGAHNAGDKHRAIIEDLLSGAQTMGAKSGQRASEIHFHFFKKGKCAAAVTHSALPFIRRQTGSLGRTNWVTAMTTRATRLFSPFLFSELEFGCNSLSHTLNHLRYSLTFLSQRIRNVVNDLYSIFTVDASYSPVKRKTPQITF